MPSKDHVTISTKVHKDYARYLKEKSESEGKSLGEMIREALEGDRQAYDRESIEGKIAELCFLYDVSPEAILSSMDYLLSNGKLCVEDGKIHFKPMNCNPEYVSVDEAIERMRLSPKEEKRLRQEIMDRLEIMVNNDYTGNGGGL